MSSQVLDHEQLMPATRRKNAHRFCSGRRIAVGPRRRSLQEAPQTLNDKKQRAATGRINAKHSGCRLT